MKPFAAKMMDWTTRFAGAKSAVTELHGADRDIQGAIEKLLEERQRLIRAWPEKAELVRSAYRQVDARHEQWAREHGPRLVAAAAGRLTVAPTGEVTGITPGDIGAALPDLDFNALCGLNPAAVKQQLAAIIEATAYTPGPPLEQRAKLIAEKDARRHELEAQHKELVDAAAAAGITLQDLPANRAARIRDERDREQIDRHNALNASAIRRGAMEPAERIEDAR